MKKKSQALRVSAIALLMPLSVLGGVFAIEKSLDALADGALLPAAAPQTAEMTASEAIPPSVTRIPSGDQVELTGDIRISAGVGGPAAIESVTLHYQIDGGEWQTADMPYNPFKKLYEFTDAAEAYAGIMQYYISALDVEGNIGYAGSEEAPFTLTVGEVVTTAAEPEDTNPPLLQPKAAPLFYSGEPLTLEATVVDEINAVSIATGVDKVTLYFKAEGAEEYTAVEMMAADDAESEYGYQISGELLECDTVYYYFEASDLAGNISNAGSAEYPYIIEQYVETTTTTTETTAETTSATETTETTTVPAETTEPAETTAPAEEFTVAVRLASVAEAGQDADIEVEVSGPETPAAVQLEITNENQTEILVSDTILREDGLYQGTASAFEGETKVTVTPKVLLADGTEITGDPLAVEFTEVSDPTLGDVNGDGSVNLKDVVTMRRQLAGGWEQTFIEEHADFNGDGVFNLKDVVMLRQYLAGWITHP